MRNEDVRYRGVAVVLLAALVGCDKSPETEAAPAGNAGPASAEPIAVAPEPPREPSPLERMMAQDSFADAIEQARPLMTDTFDETSPGAVLFAVWATKKLRWSDVAVGKNETSFARVRKDSDTSRGKRMCLRGRIIQIAKDGSAGDPMFVGLMLIGYSEIARFIAVGDTGELVERSRARLCGVVTGTYDYSNSAGGTGHAVSMVGMFDLPENRDRLAP